MKKSSIARLLLVWLLLAAFTEIFAAVSIPQRPLSTLGTVAVIYDEDDDPGFAGIIKGIRDAADVVIYRITPSGERIALADASYARVGGRAVQLAYNGTGSIAVVYPDVAEPFRSVFTRIIEGIESKTKTKVASYTVGSNQNPQDLATELRRQNVSVVIALGRNGHKATSSLDRDISVVVGGVVTVADPETRGLSVHSLAPDPALLFTQLKAMVPGIRRVFVVYDSRQNAWLIRLARDAAKANGMELVAMEAADLKSAMRHYQEIFAAAEPKKDALWLPQDSVTVDDLSVLPMVLQETWSRSITLFSSNLAHVRRGALFSLYPNNLELGHNLAITALNRMSSGSPSTNVMLPLKDVLIAVNTRTAVHLGVSINPKAFDSTYPEQ